MKKILLIATLLGVAPLTAAQTALDDYVGRVDPNFGWSLEDSDDGLFVETYLLNVTSQQWRSAAEVDRPVWRHDVTVADPDFTFCGGNDSRHTAILLINGGRNPVSDRLDDDNVQLAETAARAFCSVIVILDQVPNQPLNFTDELRRSRTEDEILAYSFHKFLQTGDPTWPVHLAMTKAAVATMDAVEAFSRSGRGVQDIDDFIVLGGSKRGWTTWLTAAVDERVKAIVPISIDMLNLDRQFEHHWGAYGFYAPAVNDYAEFDIGCRLLTPRGQALLDIVDPLSYAPRYTMPKLIVNSSGDQFFLSDSSRFYYDLLPEPKWLRYTANTDHAQGDTGDIVDLILSARSWVDDLNDGKTPPRYDWRFRDDGAIELRTFDNVDRVRLWRADNPIARDFRLENIGKAWQSSELRAVEEGLYVASVDTPAQGFRAFFIEVEFEEGSELEANQTFSSGVRVLPDTLPYAGTQCPSSDDYSNLWWNPRQSGQALQLVQQGRNLAGAWYLYDGNGVGTWVNFIGTLDGSGAVASGQLLRFNGPPPGDGFDPDRVSSEPIGSATLRFRSAHSATLDYTLAGVPGTMQLVPYERLADDDFSRVWYDPTRDGQGVQLVRREQRLAGAWYLYNDAGSASWVTFDGVLQNGMLQADLLRFTGPPLGVEWDPEDVSSETVGTIVVTLVDAGSVRFEYRIDGVDGVLDLVPFEL